MHAVGRPGGGAGVRGLPPPLCGVRPGSEIVAITIANVISRSTMTIAIIMIMIVMITITISGGSSSSSSSSNTSSSIVAMCITV